jgi:hypothetical protein
MLEQAAHIRLVVVLGRRSLAEALPVLGLCTEEAVEQRAKRGALDRLQQPPQVDLEQLDRALGALGELLGVVLVRRGRADRSELDLAAELGVDREAAADQDDRARHADLEAFGDPVPGDRGHRAGAIGEHQTEKVVAVLLLPALALPDHEHGRDLLAVGEPFFRRAHDQRHRVPGSGAFTQSARLAQAR